MRYVEFTGPTAERDAKAMLDAIDKKVLPKWNGRDPSAVTETLGEVLTHPDLPNRAMIEVDDSEPSFDAELRKRDRAKADAIKREHQVDATWRDGRVKRQRAADVKEPRRPVARG